MKSYAQNRRLCSFVNHKGACSVFCVNRSPGGTCKRQGRLLFCKIKKRKNKTIPLHSLVSVWTDTGKKTKGLVSMMTRGGRWGTNLAETRRGATHLSVHFCIVF